MLQSEEKYRHILHVGTSQFRQLPDFENLDVLSGLLCLHYDNTPMQYTANFHGCKNDNFQMKKNDIFHIFAQNIDSGYTLGGSNEYQQSMFQSKNKKICIPL